MRTMLMRLVLATSVALWTQAALPAQRLTLDPTAIMEAIPLVQQALEIDARARAR